MGSISKALSDYLEVDMPWDKTVNNIIVMQACRHAIAHAGLVADEKLINQLRFSSDRDIQKNLQEGNNVQFAPDEIILGGNEMIKYISVLSRKIFDT